MINNFLLQNSVCLCQQITSLQMPPCHICGRWEAPPAIESRLQARKVKQERQRQEILDRYDPAYNEGKLPF